MMRGTCAAAVAAILTLAGCSATDDGASDAEAGALAAAQAYVDAIAAQDVEAVDAMTDPAVFDLAAGPDRDTDIRAALPDAVDPITDPWVSLFSPTNESRYGATEYVIGVSYDIKDLTGGGTIVVALDDGADPDQVDSWTVTDPLIVRATAYGDQRTVPKGRIGSVELTFPSTSNVGLWGYPGGYLLEPATPTPKVDPIWIAVGAADASPWDDSLPMLELPEND